MKYFLFFIAPTVRAKNVSPRDLALGLEFKIARLHFTKFRSCLTYFVDCNA